MNDPHVAALYYWVDHDDSVDYENAVPLEYADDEVEVHLEKRQLTLRPKRHHATAQEAREALEGFIRDWEFNSTVEAGSKQFALLYMDADIIDRSPTPPPPGTVDVSLSARARAGLPKVSARLRVGKANFPSPPGRVKMDSGDPTALAMLSRLDRYHEGRETLAAMSYFCLTVMGEKASAATGNTDTRKAVRDYYRISVPVQRKASSLSSERGGNDARKAEGLQQEFTNEEKKFLLTAVQTFTKRVTEKSANPAGELSLITMADLPELETKVANTQGGTVGE